MLRMLLGMPAVEEAHLAPILILRSWRHWRADAASCLLHAFVPWLHETT